MGGLRAQRKENEPATAEEVRRITNELKLKPTHAAFARELVIDYDMDLAAKRAGISKATAYRIIKKPEVKEAIHRIQDLHSAYKDITPNTLRGQMAIWANANMGDYFTGDWILKPTEELTRAQLSCIKSIEKRYNALGQESVKITLHDPVKANENLARVDNLYASSALHDIAMKVRAIKDLHDMNRNSDIDKEELNQLVREINAIQGI